MSINNSPPKSLENSVTQEPYLPASQRKDGYVLTAGELILSFEF